MLGHKNYPVALDQKQILLLARERKQEDTAQLFPKSETNTAGYPGEIL